MGAAEQARDKFKALRNKRMEAIMLQAIARAQQNQGDEHMDKALKNITLAIDMFKELKDHQGHAEALMMRSEIRRRKKDFQTAIGYCKDARVVFEKVDNKTGQGMAL